MSNAAPANDPSMDEILSSIRQIISEDDVDEASAGVVEGAVQDKIDDKVEDATSVAENITEPEVLVEESLEIDGLPDSLEAAAMETFPDDEVLPTLTQEAGLSEGEVEDPLELSENDVLLDSPENFGTEMSGLAADIDSIGDDQVIGEDIVFDAPEDPLGLASPSLSLDNTDINAPAIEDLIDSDDIAFEESESEIDADPQSVTMPDARVRDRMAEKLLSPATSAATSAAFSSLSALSLSPEPATVEDLIRGMLRPMLKEWLDDNLPAMVERLVQEEIERVSRG